MKTSLLSILVLVLLCGFSIQTDRKYPSDSINIIFVRHAEKFNDGTKDPPLSRKGVKRSIVIADMLRQTKLSAVYTTPYKRTRQTVEPLSKEHQLTPIVYDPKKPLEFLKELIEKGKGNTVLVCGHSNTIPQLINTLTGTNEFADFDEHDFDNLILVNVVEIGNASVVHLRLDKRK